MPSSDFKSINVMYSFCYSIKPLLEYFENKQKAYNKIIHRLLTQDGRIFIPKFNPFDTLCLLSLHTECIWTFY